jgi:hypothetical protein
MTLFLYDFLAYCPCVGQGHQYESRISIIVIQVHKQILRKC